MAIRAALKGQMFITPALASDVLRQIQHGAQEASGSAEVLTPASARSCGCWRRGARPRKSPRRALDLVPHRPEFHKYQMMEAHGLRSNAELIHFAIKHGIVTI